MLIEIDDDYMSTIVVAELKDYRDLLMRMLDTESRDFENYVEALAACNVLIKHYGVSGVDFNVNEKCGDEDEEVTWEISVDDELVGSLGSVGTDGIFKYTQPPYAED